MTQRRREKRSDTPPTTGLFGYAGGGEWVAAIVMPECAGIQYSETHAAEHWQHEYRLIR
jgi:hypothetical protein